MKKETIMNNITPKGASMILPSWKDTRTKQAILDFVAAVTDQNGPHYVPPAERIAAFDNDGTLWCEHPMPVQIIAILDALATVVQQNSALAEQPLYRAAAERDMAWFAPYMSNERIPELIGMMLAAGAGETQAEFEARSAAWLAEARHPRFGKPYTQVIYRPMVELLDYLRDNDFRVFIVSGGGMDFVRLFSETIYGVPRENVVGSNMKLSWEYRDGAPVLVRQAGIVEPFNDGTGKPINIKLHVGRPPILVGGNSNGDVPLMEFAAASGKPFLN
ncbi:haloacid dehalogenase-like hydrolase, partial [Methanophagales archaeon]